MPRGDGTGPAGAGSMTGRAAGYCAGYGVPGFASPVPGYGRGRGFGRGYGRGFGAGWGRGMGWGGAGQWPEVAGYVPPPAFPPAMSQEQELSGLKEQADQLESMLKEVNDRITGLQSREE